MARDRRATGRYTPPKSEPMQRYLARARRAGPGDLASRIPEVQALQDKTITVLGLGGLGAPVALDLVRSGVGALQLVDNDVVDPATVVRWPLGLTAAEHPKVAVIRDFIAANYPYTTVELLVPTRLGAPRLRLPQESDLDFLDTILESTDLIIDATTETGVNDAIAQLARDGGVPYVVGWATAGCWGGFVARVLPDRGGCWRCVRYALNDGTIPAPKFDPNGNVQPIGCADPTFTGTSFDLAAISNVLTRLSVSTLCEAYATVPWDIAVIEVRDGDVITGPRLSATQMLQRHPDCPVCG